MKETHVVSWLGFAAVLALSAIIATLYLYNIYEWRNYPDFGFGYRTATGIKRVGIVTPHGRDAGFRERDLIHLVNGIRYDNLAEFRAAQRRNLGETNVYLIQRGEEYYEIAITNIPIGFEGSFKRSGYLWLLGLCYLFIGTIVFLMKSHERASWVFFVLMSIFGLFITFLYRTGKLAPFFLEQVGVFLYATAPAVLFHFALTFPGERTIVRKYPWMLTLPYFVSAALFLSIMYATPVVIDAPPLLRRALVVYMAVSMLYFVGSHADHLYRSPSEITRARAKVVLLGFALTTFIPLADYVVSSIFNVYVLPGFGYYLPFLIFFPLSIGYSIIRYNLFEFDAVIKRTYGYILTTGIVAGVYGIFVLVSNIAFGHLEITKSQTFPLIFVLLVVFFFNPIRDRVQRFINRTFYRSEYDYQETVQRISESMCSLQNLAQVTRAMMETALGAMFIDSGSLLILDRSSGTYDRRIHVAREDPLAAFTGKEVSARSSSTGDKSGEPVAGARKGNPEGLSLPADLPFLMRVAEKRKIVSRYDLEEDPFFEKEREAGRQVFDHLGATLLVPIVYENELKGIMGLGDKKSGKFYRIEDIKLLNTLANQGAVAIENAMLLDDVIEKERMEEELSIARGLQMSMLPADCPRLDGFDITALCVPAREVGGDYYDFIDMGAESAGIIVGDVTGKGVSGALVMAASRSVFRMLSEDRLDLGSIMAQANRRARKDIRTGMFVAVLYAILDGPRRALRLCSAGQTQPVLFSSKDGNARLIETAGDNFPVGIVDDVAYEETVLPLEPGDRIVFYTDGIVEAMNEKGEIFGFDRLLEAVRQSGSGEAGEVLAAVKSQVDAFVGLAPQHDDITLIVVGVKG